MKNLLSIKYHALNIGALSFKTQRRAPVNFTFIILKVILWVLHLELVTLNSKASRNINLVGE
jgi:hypothetical protein